MRRTACWHDARNSSVACTMNLKTVDMREIRGSLRASGSARMRVSKHDLCRRRITCRRSDLQASMAVRRERSTSSAAFCGFRLADDLPLCVRGAVGRGGNRELEVSCWNAPVS